MLVNRRVLVCCACLLILATTACRRRDTARDYARKLPPGSVGVREIPPAEWPRFNLAASDRDGLLRGIEHSIAWLGVPSSATHFPKGAISRDQVRRGLERFRAILNENPAPSALNQILRREFRVYRSIGYDDRGAVLFTGYYTPIFDASLERTPRFRYPLYRRPEDLVNPDNPKDISWQRLPGGGRQPYPTRTQLEDSGALRGLELVWLAHPYDPYNIQVQGSAKLRLRDGRIIEVGYAGTNGHPYVSLGQELVKDGHLPADGVSLQSIRAFFARHPDRLPAYTRRNPRFVFFKEERGGPYGSLGKPVTPDVSIATDKDIFPPGALCFVETRLGREGDGRPYAAFRLDQDTGGAIRAPGKCDLYMGEGAAAERRAGIQKAEGRLYYLVAR